MPDNLSTSLIPSDIPENGFNIPLIVASTNFKHSSINSSITIYNDHVGIKIIFSEKILNYADIDSIDLIRNYGGTFRRIGAWGILFRCKESPFVNNCRILPTNDDTLIGLLKFFKSKSVPLSPKAENFVS